MINKKAASRLDLFNPLYTAGTREGAENGLPLLSDNPYTNRAAWNALAVGGGSILAGALITALAHETSLLRYRRKHKEALESKLNSVMPIASPNVDLDDTHERKQRRIAELEKTASSKKAPDATEGFGARVVAGALPLVLMAGGLYAGHKGVSELYENNMKDEVKSEIDEYENELEALQARLIALRMKNGDKKPAVEDDIYAMDKLASADDETTLQTLGRWGDNVATGFGLLSPNVGGEGGKRGLIDLFTEYPFITASIIAAGTAGVGYHYFRKKNEEDKKAKVMEELAATNLSNIPPRLSLSLDDEGNPIVVGNTYDK